MAAAGETHHSHEDKASMPWWPRTSMSFGALEEIAKSPSTSRDARRTPATHAEADPRAGGLGEIDSKGLVVPEAVEVRSRLSASLTAPLERASVRLFIAAPDEAGALALVRECMQSASSGKDASDALDEPKIDPEESEEDREARLQAYMRDVGSPLLQVCLLGTADAWQQGRLGPKSSSSDVLKEAVAVLDRVKARADASGVGVCQAARDEGADCIGRAQREALAAARAR